MANVRFKKFRCLIPLPKQLMLTQIHCHIRMKRSNFHEFLYTDDLRRPFSRSARNLLLYNPVFSKSFTTVSTLSRIIYSKRPAATARYASDWRFRLWYSFLGIVTVLIIAIIP